MSIPRVFKPNSHCHFRIMILKINFPRVPDTYIRTAFAKNRHFLAPTYLAIAKAEATYDERRPNEFVRLRSLRYQHRGKQPYFNKEILDELEFAKTKFREMKRQRQEEEDAKFAASLNYKEQEDSGQLMEWCVESRDVGLWTLSNLHTASAVSAMSSSRK